ncbi:MAG: hypothetical protein ACI4TW_04340, partial [Prevotella sp.]
RILKDGEIIYRKTYNDNILYDGTYTDIPVETPITIEPGCKYYFALQIMNDANVMPLGIDGTSAVNNKGNALSFDCVSWFPATQLGIDGNFNIRVNLKPNPAHGEELPVGYNIYRDGVKINSVTMTGGTDVVESAGKHEYSVTSVYADGGESSAGNTSTVNIVAIDGRYAPYSVDANVHINRYVTLRWDYPTATAPVFPTDITTRPVSHNAGLPEYVFSFEGKGNEMAVASDGNYIYTSVYSEDGKINRYSLNGTFIESFVIDGMEGIRNLTYDSEYFYATDNLNDFKKIDMQSRTVLETIAISEYARHISFIPDADGGNGGFEIGDWQTSIYVDRNGSKQGDGPALLGAAGTAYHNGKLYAFEQGSTDNAYSIGVYDYATGERTGEINLADYVELSLDESTMAGGMSTVTTPEGMTYLAVALQNNSNTQFVFIEAESKQGVAGYNILRNGVRLNEELLTHRYFADTLTIEGEYDYTLETVYIDAVVSETSAPAHVVIVPTGEAVPPVNLRAAQSSYGYNVLVSFADPDLYAIADKGTDFESSASSTDNFVASYGGWQFTDTYAYDGNKSISAGADTEARLLIDASDVKYLRMAVCNADDHNGNGSIDLLYSTSGSEDADLILLGSYTTTELWRELTVALPAGTEYVVVRKKQGVAEQFIDALRLFASEPADKVYAYDIFRNGEQINSEPVRDISYLDRNMLPGHYDYQARLTTITSAVSELSPTAGIDLSYDNGGLAPTNLTAQLNDNGSVQLAWQVPALGSPIYLRWHNGN